MAVELLVSIFYPVSARRPYEGAVRYVSFSPGTTEELRRIPSRED